MKKTRLSGMRSLACHVMDRSRKHSLIVSTDIKIDMTRVLEVKKLTGYSLYTILSKAISDVMKENTRFHILNSVFIKRIFRSKLVEFEHHHFSYTFPKLFGGEEIPITYIIHDLDTMSLKEIDEKIKEAGRMPMEEFPTFKTLKVLTSLPSFVQKLLILLNDFLFDPTRRDGSFCINNMGKTNIHSFIPISTKTLMLAFPGIDKNNESLVTAALNHYIIDGKRVVAFLDTLKERLENLELTN